MPAGSLTVPDEAAAPLRRTDDVRQALAALWPHFLWAGLFSSAINLLYLSSPLYLMQVYNRVLLNENVSTLILLTLILAIALLAMPASSAPWACSRRSSATGRASVRRCWCSRHRPATRMR